MLEMQSPESNVTSAFSPPKKGYVDINWVNSMLEFVGKAVELDNVKKTIKEYTVEQYNQENKALLAQENIVYQYYQKKLADKQASNFTKIDSQDEEIEFTGVPPKRLSV